MPSVALWSEGWANVLLYPLRMAGQTNHKRPRVASSILASLFSILLFAGEKFAPVIGSKTLIRNILAVASSTLPTGRQVASFYSFLACLV